ncbi:MAG: hypothetical protein HRU26_07210 [Psychroserpens sp.]|nr:hypothetical protein [Psychroserpens sp.]
MTFEAQNKFRLILHAISCIIAIVIILDLVLPGKTITENIVSFEQDLEQYYNAGGNYHYSFKVKTNNHEFSVSEAFADLNVEGQTIEFSVSRIFNEINWYKLSDSTERFTYSLRTYSGLVLPLAVLISILIAYVFKRHMDLLIYILQILLLADLIYLMF